MQSTEKVIFDTRFDTKKYFVTMRSKFSLRSDTNKDGKSLLYLDISDKKKRIRLKTDIFIEKKYWDSLKQRVKSSPNFENFNLIIENLEAKIITIKTRYTLMQQFLSAERLVEEIQNVSPDFDCKYDYITKDFRKTLSADKFPQIQINFDKFRKSSNGNYISSAEVKLMNKVRTYNIELYNNGKTLSGKQQVRFSDFGITPPKKMAGMIVVKDELDLSFIIQNN